MNVGGFKPCDSHPLGPWDPGTLGPWDPGTLGPWDPGTLGPWDPGTLGPWDPGTLGPWDPGTLGPWDPGTLGPWDPGTLGPWDPGTVILRCSGWAVAAMIQAAFVGSSLVQVPTWAGTKGCFLCGFHLGVSEKKCYVDWRKLMINLYQILGTFFSDCEWSEDFWDANSFCVGPVDFADQAPSRPAQSPLTSRLGVFTPSIPGISINPSFIYIISYLLYILRLQLLVPVENCPSPGILGRLKPEQATSGRQPESLHMVAGAHPIPCRPQLRSPTWRM